MRIEDHEIPQSDSFCYLGSIISKDGEIAEDAEHMIKVGWLKWRLAYEVLCDRRMPIRLKGKFYGRAISKDWEIDEDVEHRIKAGWLNWILASGVLYDQ